MQTDKISKVSSSGTTYRVPIRVAMGLFSAGFLITSVLFFCYLSWGAAHTRHVETFSTEIEEKVTYNSPVSTQME